MRPDDTPAQHAEVFDPNVSAATGNVLSPIRPKTQKRSNAPIIAVAAAIAVVAVVGIGVLVTHQLGLWGEAPTQTATEDSLVAVFGGAETVDIEADRPIVPSEAMDTPYSEYRVRIVEAEDADGKPLNIFDYPQLDVRSSSGFCMADFSDALPSGTYQLVATCNGRARYLPPLRCSGASLASDSSKASDVEGASNAVTEGNVADSADEASSDESSQAAPLCILPADDPTLSASQAAASTIDETKHGKYAAFLNVLNQLQEQYGKPSSTYEGSILAARGVCFAQLIDFGDSQERLVVAHYDEEGIDGGNFVSGAKTISEHYIVEVYEYDESADSATIVAQSAASCDHTGSNFWVGISSSESDKRYLYTYYGLEHNTYMQFFGICDDGSFGLAGELESSWDGKSDRYYINGSSATSEEFDKFGAAYVLNWGTSESESAIAEWYLSNMSESSLDEDDRDVPASIASAIELMDKLTHASADDDSNVKVIGDDDAARIEQTSKANIESFLMAYFDAWEFEDGSYAFVGQNDDATQCLDPASELYAALSSNALPDAFAYNGGSRFEVPMNVQDVTVEQAGEGVYTATITYYESAQRVDQLLWNELVAAGTKTAIFRLATNSEGLITSIEFVEAADSGSATGSATGSSASSGNAGAGSGNASSGGASASSSDGSASDSAASSVQYQPFWGIWVYASHDWDEAVAKVAEVREAGYFNIVYETTDWENLNDEHWYVVTAGTYGSEEEANAALPKVQAAGFTDAYVKWSGAYVG